VSGLGLGYNPLLVGIVGIGQVVLPFLQVPLLPSAVVRVRQDNVLVALVVLCILVLAFLAFQ